MIYLTNKSNGSKLYGRIPPETEVDFLNNFQRLLTKDLDESGLAWKLQREVTVGNIIADLVVALSIKGNDLTSFPGTLNINECVILSLLRRYGATRIDILEKRSGLNKAGLRNGQLDKLIGWNLITSSKGGKISLANTWPNSINIIAFEAKLQNWSSALKQAAGYKIFADESYVVLPASYAQPALKSKQYFETNGVGLYITNKIRYNVEILSKLNTCFDWRREFVVSRILQSIS